MILFIFHRDRKRETYRCTDRKRESIKTREDARQIRQRDRETDKTNLFKILERMTSVGKGKGASTALRAAN